jgi:hypothetical protein
MATPHHGSCLCGKVKFTIEGPIGAPDACHCKACRKQSGHYFASGNVKRAALAVTGTEYVKWYQSSEKIRRGFCANCGSSLFWDPPEKDYDWIAVAMGALDSPTDMQLHHHIFVSEKGDYYAITDGLPQREQF